MQENITDQEAIRIADARLRAVLDQDRDHPGVSLTGISPISCFTAELFVRPDGRDSNEGTVDRPLATLSAARDHLRALRSGGLRGNLRVNIGRGHYALADTLVFQPEDGGRAGEWVVYQAEEAGSAILSGGQVIEGFKPVTDKTVSAHIPESARAKVVQCSLPENGIKHYGDLHPLTQRTKPTAHSVLELYVDGEVMPSARWPKDGWIEDSVVIPSRADADGNIREIHYSGSRPERWQTADQAAIRGYLQYNWLETTVLLKRIDAEGSNLVADQPFLNCSQLNVPAYPGVPAEHSMRYRVVNLLEELSEPGEWFLDRHNGMLYFYPPVPLDHARVEISALAAPMVTATGVSRVRFEGLVFELGQQDALHMIESSDCLVRFCAFRRMAGGSVNIQGGKRNRIQDCRMHTLGRNGIWLSGGDRHTLEPCEHTVENCHIHHFSRLEGTNTPAVHINGVGTRIAHNHIHHTPCHALRINGNDHLVEYNEIHDAVTETDDQGAIDMFGNPTFRGCMFRYNYIHHIGTERSFAVGGIRCDDCISGVLIYGNIFFRASDGHFGAVQMNGGRENIVFGNLIVDCKTGFSGGWTPGWTENNRMWIIFNEGKSPGWTEYIMSDLYRERYPLLSRMKTDKPLNFIWNNIVINAERTHGLSDEHVCFRDNVFDVTIEHALNHPSAAELLALPDADIISKAGMPAIDASSIGRLENQC